MSSNTDSNVLRRDDLAVYMYVGHWITGLRSCMVARKLWETRQDIAASARYIHSIYSRPTIQKLFTKSVKWAATSKTYQAAYIFADRDEKMFSSMCT